MEDIGIVFDYIARVTGERPVPESILPAVADRLPVYLDRSWQLSAMRLFGHAVVIAAVRGQMRTGLARVVKDWAILSTQLETDVVLLIPDLQSYERRELIQQRVPFIVPGRQLFLPMLLVDFRERFAHPLLTSRKTMSWVSQLIILQHMLHNNVENCALAEIAMLLGYTPMAVTHGIKELVSLGLCSKVSQGRTRLIRFDALPQTVWERASEYMRSPVVRRYPAVLKSTVSLNAVEAGLSALSKKSNLSYHTPEIIATTNKQIQLFIEEGIIETRLYESDCAVVLEGWAYDPHFFSQEGVVDDFSLYLSLKDDPDERVQLALHDLMEQQRW